MKYADKQHIAYFLQIESALFYSHSEHTPKGGRATPYSDSGYAVERTELRSTAQLGHLYGSRSGILRLGSLRCRAYLAELYSVPRRAVRDNPSSSMEYRHLPYGIAHLPVRTATFGQKQSEFQCWFDPSKSRIAPYTIA
ncbi:hypothetical protein [Porphyromonas gingivalis]|uniref:hypothetical protein n=1 Tax=Porphyromonas gingivalis TaxID=837 RepID=UPI0015CF1BA2|nr:hypothetical protein [Porphyromonas gingivalis]